MKHNYFYKDVLSVETSGTVVNLMFVTGSVETEAKALIYANEDFTLEILEGVTATGGTPLTAYACNRNDTRTPQMALYSAPTITDDGTKIWKSRTFASKGTTGVASLINYTLEVKPSTKYVWRLTKNSSGTHFVDADFFWSEINPNSI